jgi:hypothetical protein
MRKALAGEACSPPPASPPPYTAAIAAEKFGFDGAESGIQGQWTYLLSLGRGGQGEAGLWMSVRQDENNNVIDVSFQVLHRPVYRAPEWSFMKPMDDITDTFCSAWWSKTSISRSTGKILQYGSKTPTRAMNSSSENRLCTVWRVAPTKLVQSSDTTATKPMPSTSWHGCTWNMRPAAIYQPSFAAMPDKMGQTERSYAMRTVSCSLASGFHDLRFGPSSKI